MRRLLVLILALPCTGNAVPISFTDVVDEAFQLDGTIIVRTRRDDTTDPVQGVGLGGTLSATGDFLASLFLRVAVQDTVDYRYFAIGVYEEEEASGDIMWDGFVGGLTPNTNYTFDLLALVSGSGELNSTSFFVGCLSRIGGSCDDAPTAEYDAPQQLNSLVIGAPGHRLK